MKSAVIAGYVRSPFAPANKSPLAQVRPDEMTAQVVRALLERTRVKADDIEDLLLGCAFPEGEQGLNVAKLVAMMAGLPQSVAGATINRFCGSSMQSVHSATGAIAIGAGEVFICAGIESMSRVPMMGFNPMPHPKFAAEHPEAYIGMGETAENVSKKWGISRADQEAFAVESHRRAAKAQADGLLKDEIVAIGGVDADLCIRPDTTAEGLASLKLAFDQNGTVTAGTSSPLTDGAVALLVTSEDYAKAHKLDILARIKSVAVAGCAPEIMGIGPVPAATKALARAGLSASALDVIELNEAFAAQSLACIRDLQLDKAKVNIDGGAIALGHPLGATGARIVGKAASLLKRTGGKYALATQCIGGGQGIATILEAV
ncbi:MAG TPA: thiolase family protein [Magnetospirillaceae bacterium]|nr:thiolase family protein [Magnetospirillaceae bacterium]